jgi:hypothetical protein
LPFACLVAGDPHVSGRRFRQVSKRPGESKGCSKGACPATTAGCSGCFSCQDAVQHLIKDVSSIPATQLIQLDELDCHLRKQKTWIFNTIDVEHWRSLVNPPEQGLVVA